MFIYLLLAYIYVRFDEEERISWYLLGSLYLPVLSLGDNKGGIARVFSIVLDMYRHIFDMVVFLELFFVFNVRDALFNAYMGSWIRWVFDRNRYAAIVTVIITAHVLFALTHSWVRWIGILNRSGFFGQLWTITEKENCDAVV